eukprot:m.92334 g.92334  ORF g.92334 m.92334 type:complete len:95 (+) comp12356_c0_seq11:438-722(+)
MVAWIHAISVPGSVSCDTPPSTKQRIRCQYKDGIHNKEDTNEGLVSDAIRMSPCLNPSPLWNTSYGWNYFVGMRGGCSCCSVFVSSNNYRQQQQ